MANKQPGNVMFVVIDFSSPTPMSAPAIGSALPVEVGAEGGRLNRSHQRGNINLWPHGGAGKTNYRDGWLLIGHSIKSFDFLPALKVPFEAESKHYRVRGWAEVTFRSRTELRLHKRPQSHGFNFFVFYLWAVKVCRGIQICLFNQAVIDQDLRI